MSPIIGNQITQSLVAALLIPAHESIQKVREIWTPHSAACTLVPLGDTPAERLLVVLVASGNGEQAQVLIQIKIDVDHTFQALDASSVEADIPVSESNRRIARAGEQLLPDHLHLDRIEHPDQFLPPCFPGGFDLFLVCLLVKLILIHAVLFHPFKIVSASFFSSASFSAVKMFISSSSFAGRRTSQSPA